LLWLLQLQGLQGWLQLKITKQALKKLIQEELAHGEPLDEAGRSLPEWPNMVARAEEVLMALADELGNREIALQAAAEAVRNMRKG